jgi:penicillin G amidase
MRFLKFLLSLLATGGLIYALSTSFAVKGVATPAFGNLINPFSGFWQNATTQKMPTFDLKDGAIQGLSKPVNVEFDDREVPHIFAENIHDAVFMQGYLHAQNRLWQMDIATRAASGRLSEVIASEKAFENDRNERRYGMLWAAENAVKGWQKDPEGYKMLESYVAGVNAYIASLSEKNYPVEFKVLGYKPEPWTVLKTALFFKNMCKTLARGDLDVDASNSLAILGETDFNKLIPDIMPAQKPIVPSGTKWNFGNTSKAETPLPDASTTYDVENDMEHIEGIGSNNWVVGPKKTQSGKPILCGDPHLALNLPSIWYECQITTPEMNAYGVSLPGIPFVVIGFNDHIAWTQTNAMLDVAEWYKIKWTNASRKQYELDGQVLNVTEKIEEYQVKGRGLVRDTVKYTKFGPVVVENSTKSDDGLAFRWLCHDESKSDLSVFYKLDKAKNYDEFCSALKEYAFPMQNFAFASETGDYAIYTQGRMPKMQKGSGRKVSDGSTSKNLWGGDVPFEQMPHVKNHPQGFVMSANQNQTDGTYPYDYHSYLFETVRSRILHTKLDTAKNVTFEDMKKLQNDVYSLDAAESIPIMVKNVDTTQLSPLAKVALNEIKKWDFQFTKDTKGGLLYDVWVGLFRKYTWDELHSFEVKARYLTPRPWATMKLLKDDPKNKYFDYKATPEVEDGHLLLAQTLNYTIDTIAKLTLLNLGSLDYSSYKNTTINHVGQIPGFGTKTITTGGNYQCINCIKKGHGPSWRMIVEPGPDPKAYIVYPGGQTGNPGAKQYDEFIEKWSVGDYYEALYLKKAGENNARIIKSVALKPM